MKNKDIYKYEKTTQDFYSHQWFQLKGWLFEFGNGYVFVSAEKNISFRYYSGVESDEVLFDKLEWNKINRTIEYIFENELKNE